MLFADAIGAFQRAGNVPQLVITLASVPALFERLDRLEAAATLLGALSRRAVELPSRSRARRARRRVRRKLGRRGPRNSMAEGAALDLGAAAVYARQQLDVARRDPDHGPVRRGRAA